MYGHDHGNYNFGRGRSEEIIGRAIKQTGKRDQVLLAAREYLVDNLGTLEVSMKAEDITTINALAPPGLLAAPYDKQEGWKPYYFRW